MSKNKIISVLKQIFSAKTAQKIGRRLFAFIQFLNVSYKTAMWIFGIATTLLILSTYNSILSIISLEGLIIIPLIATLVKSLLITATCFGWYNYYQLEKQRKYTQTQNPNKKFNTPTQQHDTKRNQSNRKKHFR